MRWHWVAFGYLAYLAAVAFLRPEFAPARVKLLTALAVAGALTVLAPHFGVALDVVVPAGVLLALYWLTGLFYVRTDHCIESKLLSMDGRLLGRTGIFAWYRRTPQALREYLEACYLLVYPALPIGAVVLVAAGHRALLDWYWTAIIFGEAVCFATLPWLQTRPPMRLEPAQTKIARVGPIRQLNQLIAARASIKATTIPSGHAAGAMAAALVVSTAMPVTGAFFLLLAFSIAVASVMGRYHYLLDAILGIAVAVAAVLVTR